MKWVLLNAAFIITQSACRSCSGAPCRSANIEKTLPTLFLFQTGLLTRCDFTLEPSLSANRRSSVGPTRGEGSITRSHRTKPFAHTWFLSDNSSWQFHPYIRTHFSGNLWRDHIMRLLRPVVTCQHSTRTRSQPRESPQQNPCLLSQHLIRQQPEVIVTPCNWASTFIR